MSFQFSYDLVELMNAGGDVNIWKRSDWGIREGNGYYEGLIPNNSLSFVDIFMKVDQIDRISLCTFLSIW